MEDLQREPSGEEKKSQTSHNSKWGNKPRSKVRRIVVIFLVSAWLVSAWTASAIGIWWDIGQIQEKGMYELTDPTCEGEDELDCYRSGIILIVSGVFVLISVPLAIRALTRSRRKEKLSFNAPVSKRSKKNKDLFNDPDDFDNPIFS